MLAFHKMSNIFILISAAGIFQFWTCFPSVTLPKAKPDDLKIVYYRGGGMSPYSVHFTIEKGICTYSQADMGRDHIAEFRLPDSTLQRIYQSILNEKFSTTKDKEIPLISDHETTALTVEIPSLDFSRKVQNSATRMIVSSQKENFKRLLETLLGEVETEMDKHIASFEVRFLPSAKEQGAQISVYKYFFSHNSAPQYLLGKLIPDTYDFQFYRRIEENGNSQSANSVRFTIASSITVLEVSYKNGGFQLGLK